MFRLSGTCCVTAFYTNETFCTRCYAQSVTRPVAIGRRNIQPGILPAGELQYEEVAQPGYGEVYFTQCNDIGIGERICGDGGTVPHQYGRFSIGSENGIIAGIACYLLDLCDYLACYFRFAGYAQEQAQVQAVAEFAP